MKRLPLPLLAPLALALATGAVACGAEAAEWDLAQMGRYEQSEESHSSTPLSSSGQFTDLRPGDWAYQALSQLIERQGCVAGYADGSLKGGQGITRFEAAALIQACLDHSSERSEEHKKLMAEFEREFALLRGRVDGLEANVGELGVTTFATTTKLLGEATFVLGANAFSGSAGDWLRESRADFGATTLSYDAELSFATSFHGKDRLVTTLRAGNFALSSFGGAGPTSLSQLEVAFQEDCGPGIDCGDVVAIDHLFYQFPAGDFLFSVGGRIGQDDMLALWPSVYPSETVLDVLTLAGAPAAYNKNLGAGAGVSWQRNGMAVSANYVAANGDGGDPAEGGIATAAAAGTGTVQIGYSNSRWGVAAIASSIENGNDIIAYGTNFTLQSYGNPGTTTALGLSGFWQPAPSGWLPSISAGWGLNHSRYRGVSNDTGLVATSQSWSVGLEWQDVFTSGHAMGMAVGQTPFATRLEGGASANDGNFVGEWWTKFQLTDNIAITPALFYLSRPLGGDTPSGKSFRQLGALVKTSLNF
jgi:hypothetical protein